MFAHAKASFLVSNPREQRICTIGEVFRVLKSGIFRARPRRASPSGYSPVARTPLHSPTTDAPVPLAFSPLQQRLASWHFSLLAPQVLAPNAVDHCLLQLVPECS